MKASSWRDLDAAAREREYSPSSCIGGNYEPFIAAYAERSARARAQTAGRLNLRYGPATAQTLDIFVPPPARLGDDGAAPALLVFIHGGYWQELSKDDSSFAARQCVDQGIALAALNYSLAPEATVAQMAAECRLALGWLYGNAAALGFDARRIVVAGSSAGAHLAAMAALPLHAPALVKAAILVSGIYELEPLVGTSVNDALGLDSETARALSPALQPLRGFPPSVVCWGEVETREYKRQSLDFAESLQRAGTPCRTFEIAQRNHFDVILDLADPDTLLGAATVALVRST